MEWSNIQWDDSSLASKQTVIRFVDDVDVDVDVDDVVWCSSVEKLTLRTTADRSDVGKSSKTMMMMMMSSRMVMIFHFRFRFDVIINAFHDHDKTTFDAQLSA